MVEAGVLNKVLLFICILTQCFIAAATIIFMQFWALVPGSGFNINFFILLIYGFVISVVMTLSDIYRPAFWSANLSFLKFYWARAALYLPLGAIIYTDVSTIQNYQYLQFAGGWTWAAAVFYFILAVLSWAGKNPAGDTLEPLKSAQAEN